MGKITGYRTEDFTGEGYRDLLDVCKHELLTLENSDIFDSENLSLNEKIKKLESLYAEGCSECVWLCRSVADFKEEYVDSFGDELHTIEEYDFDHYTFVGDTIILADNGKEGFLVAYKTPPTIIQSIDIHDNLLPSILDDSEAVQNVGISL